MNINDTYIKYECANYTCSAYNHDNDRYFFEGEEVNSDEWFTRIMEKYNLSELYELNILYNDYVVSNGAYYDRVYGDIYMEGNKYYQNWTMKLYPYMTITSDVSGYALQNGLARGVNGEKGNANYPMYATYPILFNQNNTIPDFGFSIDNLEEGYTNFVLTSGDTRTYLNDYRSNLVNMGFDISEVEMINIKDIKNMVYSVSNKELPLLSWYDNLFGTEPIIEDSNATYILGDLKQYLSNDYSWLWNSSYWTSIAAGSYDEGIYDSAFVYFISTAGEICATLGNCDTGVPRAGLRPAVVIDKSNIKYNINITDDNNIEVVDTAFGGDSISFRIDSNKISKLRGLSIITSSGEVIDLDVDELTIDNDGLVSISKSKFSMPFENVTLKLKWEESFINPKTGSNIIKLFIIFIFSISLFLGFYLYKNKPCFKNNK